METLAKANRNAALESDSDDDMPLSDRLQSPSKPLNGAKEGAASPDRAAPLQPKVPGCQPAQAGGAAGLSSNAAGAEAKSAGASGKAPSEPKSQAEAHAAAAKHAGAAQAGPSKASDGAMAGPSKASDGAKAGAGPSKVMEPSKVTGAQKAGLIKQAATAGRPSSAGANGKAFGAALAANGSLKRKASPVSDSSDSEDDQPLGMMPVPLKCRLSPAACAWTLPAACTSAHCDLPLFCHKLL